MVWYKEDGELNADASLTELSEHDTKGRKGMLLTIPKTKSSDEGNYVCLISNPQLGHVVISTPAILFVEHSSERPIIDPPEQTANEGEPVRFRCYVPGERNARLRWSYDRPDGALPPYVQDDHGVLTIQRADQSHHGEYYCTYDAPQGSLHSEPARLNVVSRPGAPPRPEASPTDQTVGVGEPARFHCDPNSETPARVTWGYREPNGPLRGDVVQEGDDIIVRSADESNAGEYICTATNEFGSADAAPVRLHVSENEEPPTARVVPRVWNGKPGDRHQFRCIASGVPQPEITWSGPEGGPLPDEVNDIGGGVLDFSNGRVDLNGDYTCTAVNILGEASDHGSVNIGPSLTVRTTPPGPRIVLTAGEPLEVKCEAFGEPTPEVEWLHDPGPERGDLPDDFKPVTISEMFIRHPAVGTGNAGVYTCKGSNSQASATKDIHVEGSIDKQHLIS
ncbi:unnamed protein product [Anisakis simplex]|uniref:Immunoglobulin domain protein n=1 Tax=Anisakis simplex TaxID=6269 RepID=A0A0M3KD65_ANISI|nr:unnamed protein product [Anisakis simplex]